jgi:cytidyltransferase-like protein
MSSTDQTQELINGIKCGLLQWYDFEQDAKVLYIGDSRDALAKMLIDKSFAVVCAPVEQSCNTAWTQEYKGGFDYLIAVEALECTENPEQVLQSWRSLLKEEGRLLLGMNNRFGIRYFCGDRDPYTGRNFDGIEGYRRAYDKKEDVFRGRCYSRNEMEKMLRAAGWNFFRFFSVLPDLQNPGLIYAEDYLPNEDLANRLFPTYNYPDTVFLEEAPLYESLDNDGLFHKLANAWLIECGSKEALCDVLHVTCSMERGRESALCTVVRRTGIVEKRAVYSEGEARLEKLAAHAKELKERGIPVVDTKLEGGVCQMPLIQAEVGQVYLKKLLRTDRERFLQEMDHFRDLILRSSAIVESDQGDGEGAILRKGYVDMVPLNSFYIDGEFVFYDQEFCEENYPANAIISRMVGTFYAGNVELMKILPVEELYERYGLTKYRERWQRMEGEFLRDLRKERELRIYHEACRGNVETIYANRQRMNFSTDEYQRLFVDIFRNVEGRKLILFGSGHFTKKFLAMYGQDYPVYAIVDNNEHKWGQEMEGIGICSPAIFEELPSGEYKVLICIKNYLSVVRQLEELGVKEYGIFDAGKDYPRKRKPIAQTQMQIAQTERKRYHTGYISGVFDLFHVGHLNMFKRAKEQCEYLIVGVVSDEGVRKYKEVEPFVPYEERAEMVRSCRYVDEVVKIPLEFRGVREAYQMYHFDCQFSGSDYKNNPDWLADKEFLEKHGSDMVFFPYTESTSSSKLKQLIEKRLC